VTELLWQFDNVAVAGVQRRRLDGVSVGIRPGTTAVIGRSGAGKTSLLNLLVEFERPDGGSIGTTIPESDRMPVFWVPPDDGLWPHLNAREQLEAVCPDNEANADAMNFLNDFDLADKADARIDQLSFGERSRLAVARALASRAAVLVMDEPLVHVDSARLGKYWNVIRQHCRDLETSLVIATHSPETAISHCEHAICLNDGRVVYDGSVTDLYHRPESEEQMWHLGPGNWFDAETAKRFLAEPIDAPRCVRPEQLVVEISDNGALVVDSFEFSGSIATTDLRDTRDGGSLRVVHRPSEDNQLRVGSSVVLRIISILLCCLGCAGCDGVSAELPITDVTHWSMPADGPRIPAPRSLTVGPDDEIYCLDNAGRVLVFDENGKRLREWKMPDYDVGKPEGICVFQDGRIGVADTHYHRVVFFDAEGNVLSMQGTHGEGPGQFIYPVAIIQDPQQNFYVSEYGGNDRVQKFSADGEFLLQFGSAGNDPGQFELARGLAWHDGKIYVADASNNRIQIFSADGKFLGIFGDSDKMPELEYPYDISIGQDATVYIVEYGGNRVSRFDLSGRLLGRFGHPGHDEGGFVTPWGLTVDSKSRILVADTGNRRIVRLTQR